MEIALLIVAGLALLASLITIFIVLKKKPEKVDNSESLKEIGAINNSISNLSRSIKTDISLSVNQEMLKLSEQEKKNNDLNNEKLERFQKNISESLNTRFDALNKQMDDKMAEINKKVDDKLAEGFKNTGETMAQVRERLQAIDDAQKNIEKLSTDVVSLKTVLEGNQSRGQYGEYQLSMVLHNVFGDTVGCYEEQYTMKKSKDGDDVRADAVVFMPEPHKMICIDSKFPFQQYSKIFESGEDEEKEKLSKEFAADVKKHITAISNKYIVEGKTSPHAIMFIPNDGVFAFIHHNCQDAIEYAREKNVILTSPSTLPSILMTISMVRMEMKRAEGLEQINKQLARLSKDFEMFGREWTAFSDALEKTTKKREQLDHRVGRITTKFDSIKGSEDFQDNEQIEFNPDEE